jgi:hypothetical protein
MPNLRRNKNGPRTVSVLSHCLILRREHESQVEFNLLDHSKTVFTELATRNVQSITGGRRAFLGVRHVPEERGHGEVWHMPVLRIGYAPVCVPALDRWHHDVSHKPTESPPSL